MEKKYIAAIILAVLFDVAIITVGIIFLVNFSHKHNDSSEPMWNLTVGTNLKRSKLGNWKEVNCHTYDSEGYCLNCSYRYYFDSDMTCKAISDQCKTFSNDNGQCQSCYDGFKLNQSDGTCTIKAKHMHRRIHNSLHS